MRRLPIVVAVLAAVLFPRFSSAQVRSCGTGGAAAQRAAAVGRWVAAREETRLGKGPAPIASVRDSIVVLQSDERNTPFRRPFDLDGRSLIFTPAEHGYRASNVALIWDDAPSTPLTPSGSTYPANVAHPLPFAFPFGGRSVTRLFAANDNALYVDPPLPASVSGQYLDLDVATITEPILAPLLMNEVAAAFVQPPPSIAFHDTATSSTFTWSASGTRSQYEVQATLFADGTIRFSYRNAQRVPAATVLIATGNEAWRSQKTAIAHLDDPADDATGAPADVLPSLDIRSVDFLRVADSNLLEVRINLGAPPDRARLSDDAIYNVDIAGFDVILRTTLSLDGSRDEYFVPIVGSLPVGVAARVEGSAIVMDFLEDFLPPPLTAVPMTISTRFGRTLAAVDSITKLLSFDPAPRSVAVDFSAIGENAELGAGPIGEAFTLPVLNPEGTWEELKALYQLNDSSFDGVAIYQNFDTDITLSFVSAYSTLGNAEASGISFAPEIGANQPKFPALLHLDTVAAAKRIGEAMAVQSAMHELGHRWLFYARFNDGGRIRYDLNPSFGGHPAAYVSEPAAFPVVTNSDASVMGGSRFVENGTSFTTPSTFVSYGYSWLDLYFMGLASPAEVAPFFYIANSNPPLALDYWPPPNVRVTGTKKVVTMQQVLEAMGPRIPAYPDTQREMKVLTVLLTDPAHGATDDELATLQSIRRTFEQRFAAVTGQRASLSTTFVPPVPPPPAPPRRRAVAR